MQHLLDGSKRIEWIDYLKGLSIFFVVLGHSYVSHQKIESVGWAFQTIYAFHMPLFFVLAGVTAAVSMLNNDSILRFIKARFINIFIPFVCWAFLTPLFFADETTLSSYSLENQFEILVTGNVLLWFLPALFMLQLYYSFFYFLVRKLKNTLLQFAAVGELFVLAWFLHRCFGKVAEDGTFALEWLTNASQFFIPFFFGVFLVHYKKLYRWSVENQYTVTAALLVMLFFMCSIHDLPYYRYTKSLCGICAAIVFINFFKRWKEPSVIKQQLRLIGQYSLIIYLTSGFFESRELNILLEGMNATFVQIAYGIVSLLVCYICIIFAKFIELSDILRFLLLGKSFPVKQKTDSQNSLP